MADDADDLEKEMQAAMESDPGVSSEDAGKSNKPSLMQKIMAAKWMILAAIIGIGSGFGVAFMLKGGDDDPAMHSTGTPVPTNEPGLEKSQAHQETSLEDVEGAPGAEDNPVANSEEGPSNPEGAEQGVGALFMKFDPVVVNVFEKNSIHYLKLQIVLEISNPEVEVEVNEIKPKLKDKILFIISDRSLREILAPAGKALLKEDILAEFRRVVTKGKIARLYFTEFTIQ